MKTVGELTLTTPSDREVTVTRVFHAPRALLWRTHTEPELVKKWLAGPPGWTMEVCEIDLRVGGRYRYAWRKDDGTTMGMGGVCVEIVAPERIVNTQLFDQDWTGGEAVGTLTFTEAAGRTTLVNTILYVSREARDLALQSGMEYGMAIGYDRLAEVLSDLG
jgi:uncharacterized protein YndB with AHSA1/START domain